MEVCCREANNGETWADLRLNDMIMAQFQSTSTNNTLFTEWEREILNRLLHPEVRMVSGERALQASSLFARRSCALILQTWRRVNEIGEGLDRIDELERTVEAQRDMIDSLADQVRVLEGRVSRRLSRLSCSSRPSTGSLYGNPGESIHQTVEELE